MIKKIKNTKIYQLIHSLIVHCGKNDVSGNAAQLAYYMLFSIFPTMLIAASLLAYLHIDKDTVFNLIKEFAPEQIIHFLEKNLESLFSKRNGSLLSFGILATLWSASKGMNAVMKSLNKAYHVTDHRNFILKRLLSMIFTVAMLVTVGVTLVLLVFGQQISIFVFNYLHISKEAIDFWDDVRWLITIIVIFVVFTFLYWVAPARKNRFFGVLPGAFFSTIGWAVISLGFAYYVNNFGNYSATYGSIGAVIILMLWFYMTGIILIVGGELNGALLLMKTKKKIGDIN